MSVFATFCRKEGHFFKVKGLKMNKKNNKGKLKKLFKPIGLFALVLGISASMLACAKNDDVTENTMVDEKTEIVVFATASMTETLNEIKDLYEAKNPDVKLVFTFDSSGTLKTQIEEGAHCDIFISAANKQMDQIDITSDEEKNPDRLDYVLEGTRINLLENKVVLAVPDENPKNITGFMDLATKLQSEDILLAVGNADVPVGQYSSKILTYFDLNEDELANAGKITYGTNVKEVTTQVKEESADCGIIYETDAKSAGLKTVDSASEEMCGKVLYPAAVLNISENETVAKDFLKFLQSDEARKVFETIGFTVL